MYIASLAAEQGLKVAGHPAAAAPNEEDVVFGGINARHFRRDGAELQGKMIT